MPDREVGGIRIGKGAKEQPVKRRGGRAGGAVCGEGRLRNLVERGRWKRGRGRPRRAKPQAFVPFSPRTTLPLPKLSTLGGVGAPRSGERNQERREIGARGSGSQPNGAQLDAFIPAIFMELSKGSSKCVQLGEPPIKLFLCALARETATEPSDLLRGCVGDLIWEEETFSESEERDNPDPPSRERHRERGTSHGAVVSFTIRDRVSGYAGAGPRLYA